MYWPLHYQQNALGQLVPRFQPKPQAMTFVSLSNVVSPGLVNPLDYLDRPGLQLETMVYRLNGEGKYILVGGKIYSKTQRLVLGLVQN